MIQVPPSDSTRRVRFRVFDRLDSEHFKLQILEFTPKLQGRFDTFISGISAASWSTTPGTTLRLLNCDCVQHSCQMPGQQTDARWTSSPTMVSPGDSLEAGCTCHMNQKKSIAIICDAPWAHLQDRLWFFSVPFRFYAALLFEWLKAPCAPQESK